MEDFWRKGNKSTGDTLLKYEPESWSRCPEPSLVTAVLFITNYITHSNRKTQNMKLCDGSYMTFTQDVKQDELWLRPINRLKDMHWNMSLLKLRVEWSVLIRPSGACNETWEALIANL